MGSQPVSYTHLDVYKRQIFPEVYKLTYSLLDGWNGTGRLPEVNAAMLRLQDTFDEACIYEALLSVCQLPHG